MECLCAEWTTDAVTGLPKTKRSHDAIQVYVDRLTKLKNFAPSRSTYGAKELAVSVFAVVGCMQKSARREV